MVIREKFSASQKNGRHLDPMIGGGGLWLCQCEERVQRDRQFCLPPGGGRKRCRIGKFGEDRHGRALLPIPQQLTSSLGGAQQGKIGRRTGQVLCFDSGHGKQDRSSQARQRIAFGGCSREHFRKRDAFMSSMAKPMRQSPLHLGNIG